MITDSNARISLLEREVYELQDKVEDLEYEIKELHEILDKIVQK